MKSFTRNSVIASILILLLLLADNAQSKQKSKITVGIKNIIRELMMDKITFGVAIGVVTEENTEIYCTGKTARSGGTNINENTVFRLGSTTKGFTGILLADQILQGNISLNDPVENYLPSEVKLPERKGKNIKCIDLATHSSALPVRPPDYKIMENGPYSVSQLYKYLSTVNLEWDIGTKYSYSSLGAGLIGHIITLLENKPYSQILKEKIFDPLGMNSTDIVIREDMKKRLSKGHDERKEAKWLEIPEVFAPSGSLNTTVSDMTKFISAGLEITKTPINEAFDLSRKLLRSFEDGRKLAMFWRRVELEGHTIIGHPGDTFGFSAYIGFNLENRIGVVVLSNGKMGVREIGFHILTGGDYKLSKKNILRFYYEE